MHRNCLLKCGIEDRGKEISDRKMRRCKQLLDDFKEQRWYGKLKGEAIDRTVWRTCFERSYGLVKTALTFSVGRNLYFLISYRDTRKVS